MPAAVAVVEWWWVISIRVVVNCRATTMTSIRIALVRPTGKTSYCTVTGRRHHSMHDPVPDDVV